MGKILSSLSVCFIALALLTSCNDQKCTESTVTNARASFYTKSGLTALTFDSVSIKGIGQVKDSILYSKVRKTKSVLLPLRIQAENTAFQIQFYRSNSATKNQTDTIRFYHKNKPQYISPDCGCSVFYHIDSVKYTRHRIDTVKITQPEITNQDEEHIQILF